MAETQNPKTTIKRIGGYLQRIVPITDTTGKVVGHALKPFMVELHPRDLWQILVGASVLALPISLTEEVWTLGSELPLVNIVLLSALSLFIIANFIYFNFYRFHFREHSLKYLLRVIATYVLALFTAALFLTLFGKAPWANDWLLALKRSILVAFPASMSAMISDVIK
ncbi:DUF2391 family protein [bacterium]|nr:DUF2391 family protein [bacterium]